MFKTVIFAFVVMMAAAAFSAPSEELDQHEFFEATVTGASARLPRATCDLLSAFGVADSACAVHCLAMGRKGGWCEKGVCHCRR